MKSYQSHLSDCRSLYSPRPAIRVRSIEAAGLELAEAVYAASPYPSFVASAMDGYAVRVTDVPGRLRLVGEVPAGVAPHAEVGPGTAVRIMTGSAVPVGAEAIVRVEDTATAGDHIDVAVSTTWGRNIRGIGEDVQVGDLVLAAGQLLNAPQVAALVAHNIESVLVRPRPRVAVLSTGDELVSFGQPLGPAQLVDSNGPALGVAATQAGAEVVHVGQVGDDPNTFLAALSRLPAADLIVTSGGVSMGAYDVVKSALRDQGVAFEAVAMQPGKPQAWGRVNGGVAFLGVPGNPVSALLSFELFCRAALGRERPVVAATLAEPVEHSPKGKRQFLRGDLADGVVRLVGGPQSHLIVGLARANCLIIVDEDSEALAAGQQVAAISLTV